MKKILLLTASLLLALSINAQIRWGLKAGGNLSKYNWKYNGTTVDGHKMKFGFHIGGIMEYSINHIFAIQPELQFIQNGGKSEIDEALKTNVNQLQLPVNLKVKFGADKLKIFVLAGPYFGYALSGKIKSEQDGVLAVSIDIFDKDRLRGNHFKRFDFGIGAGAGIEVSKMTFGLGYQLGLANLQNGKDIKAKLGTATLSVGYFFN